MDAAYFEAAIPEPFTILGLRLKPLSLGRYRLLKRFDCGFVADGEVVAKIQDLILGVLICSMACAEFLVFIQSTNFRREMRRWGRRVSPLSLIGILPWIGKWWRKRHGFNIIEKMKLFQSYIREHTKAPTYTVEGSEGSPSGAHWSQNVEVTLRSELGWSKEEIDEEPISKAISDYFKWLENQGRIRIISEDELRIGEENALAMMGVKNGS